MTPFNILTEPWIPVIRPHGTTDELGILPCLTQAHELREIRDTSPITELGLYRLLVAFVLDALILSDRRPEDPLDLKSLIEIGCFDSSLINAYVTSGGDVFDLFHPEKPFLQTKMSKAKAKPLAGMFPVTPSGTNVIHWHHQSEDGLEVPAKEAARLLTTVAPFMTAGGAGLSPSINGAPPVYALPVGRNLFETIVLNLPLRNNMDSGDGVVAWRSERSPGQERSQATTGEALTWRPRQIQLVPKIGDGNSVWVSQIKFEKGDSTRLNWIDSSLAYRFEKDRATPIRMRERRPLWRDAGPLLLLSESEHGRHDTKISFRRPDVVDQAFAVSDGDPLVVHVYGMRTDLKMKVYEWAKSALSVPHRLGQSTRLGALVQRELDRAEQAAFGLRNCIKALFPREGAANGDALGTIVDRAERSYWQRLELSFYPLMDAFARLDPSAPDDPSVVATAAKSWRGTIDDVTRQQFEVAAEDMDTDGDALERQVKARTRLNNALRKVLS